MGKIKNLWLNLTSASVLWFVIPVFILVITPTLWYTKPLFDLNTHDITIYKFAITVLGVTVGVGTVINSTRSASIASESIKITKEKELREQSSHPIILSFIKSFPYKAPIYKNRESNNSYSNISSNPESKEKHVSKLESIKTTGEDEETSKKLSVSNNRSIQYIDPSVNEEHLEIINIGKGSCINLEYEFNFINKEEFVGYSVVYPEKTIEGDVNLPSYEILVKQNEKDYELTVVDNNISNQPYNYRKTDIKFEFPKKNMFKNYRYLGSGEKISIPLPNYFLILSKHYAIVDILKRKVENNEIASSFLPSIEPLLNSKLIKPIGVINLSFYDESLIRTGEYSPNEKTKITYNIIINENTTIFKGDRFGIHLESNLIKSETLSNTEKNIYTT